MKLLVDTNIIIPMEPVSTLDFAVNTSLATEFHRLATLTGNHICVHPAVLHDLGRDTNRERAEVRRVALGRFESIKPVPSLIPLHERVLGTPETGSNDWVDNELLKALASDAVDYLVTEDLDIHKKARRMDLPNRVLTLAEAISMLRDLFDRTPPPPPSVQEVYAYQLDSGDPIFDSIRRDYAPGFDEWLTTKCKRKHRKAYVVSNPDGKLAGLCIIKPEDQLPDGRKGKVLKLCTFKVSEAQSGNRYGELLLKAAFDYLFENRYEYTYFTVLPQHQPLIEFAKDFGFQVTGKLDSNELVMVKDLCVPAGAAESLSPLDLHVRYGPRVMSFNGNTTHVVPIQPQYHRILFPEWERQMALALGLSLVNRPCGNSIKKAYLSRSRNTGLRSGDNLLFYRSQDEGAVTAVGIVEGAQRSAAPDEIARYVGKRTVYSYADIQRMSPKGVLAINFRLSTILRNPLSLDALLKGGVLKGAPQSITEVKKEGLEWLRQTIRL